MKVLFIFRWMGGAMGCVCCASFGQAAIYLLPSVVSETWGSVYRQSDREESVRAGNIELT